MLEILSEMINFEWKRAYMARDDMFALCSVILVPLFYKRRKTLNMVDKVWIFTQKFCSTQIFLLISHSGCCSASNLQRNTHKKVRAWVCTFCLNNMVTPLCFWHCKQSSFLWGYLMSPIIGGALVDYYGGKRVMAYGVALWSLATFLSPWAAGRSIWLFLFTRVLLGIAEGVALPSMNNMVLRYLLL